MESYQLRRRRTGRVSRPMPTCSGRVFRLMPVCADSPPASDTKSTAKAGASLRNRFIVLRCMNGRAGETARQRRGRREARRVLDQTLRASRLASRTPQCGAGVGVTAGPGFGAPGFAVGIGAPNSGLEV